jgi:exodeoxyribonuclease V alpha subunit
MAFLPPWEPAFATTVHKSQGSECDAVLLVLPEAGNRLLSREILYTAVTRARESVRIFGSEAALREALGNRVRRHSGLREYFKVD